MTQMVSKREYFENVDLACANGNVCYSKKDIQDPHQDDFSAEVSGLQEVPKPTGRRL